jgi:hypothetical protein
MVSAHAVLVFHNLPEERDEKEKLYMHRNNGLVGDRHHSDRLWWQQQ